MTTAWRGILLITMTRYLVLLRGINVGGRNKVPMAALRELLERHRHTNVSTYIASGNVILSSDQSAATIQRELEEALPKTFELDSELIAALVLTRAQLRAVVRKRPKGFGVGIETEGPRRGRYGWSGGQGTNFYVDPDGTVGILLTQVEMGEQMGRMVAEFQALPPPSG